MRAMTKKLLSALVVLAMVLSMVPVVGLPAIEANAAASTADITEAADDLMNNKFKDQSGTVKADCPHCKVNVSWEPITTGGTQTTTAGNHHYYLPKDLGTITGFLLVAKTSGSNVTCLHLNGKTVTCSNKSYAFAAGGGATLNVMGQGTVNYTGAGKGFSLDKSYVNLYGGTYTAPDGTTLFETRNGADPYEVIFRGSTRLNGTVKAASGTNPKRVTFYDTATASELILEDSKSNVKFAAGWTGEVSNFTQNSGTVVVEATAGTVYIGGVKYITSGGALVPDAGGGDSGEGGDEAPETPSQAPTETTCPACGAENVVWTELKGYWGNVAVASGHYYISENFDTETAAEDGTWEFFRPSSTTTVCLHLNGQNITSKGRFYISNSSTLNIVGDGSITYAGTSAQLFQIQTTYLNLYGGTYSCADSAKDVIYLGNTGQPHLHNDTYIKGKISWQDGKTAKVFAYDSAKIDAITVPSTGKLTLAAGWQGTIGSLTATTEVDEDGDTVIPKANVEVQGETLNGTIKFGKGIETSLKSGQLKVEDKFNPTAENSYKSYCQICEKTATWTPVSEALGTVSAETHHYYLTEDVTHTTENAWFMEVPSGATVHFNMNGCSVTAKPEDEINELQHGIQVKGTLDLFNTSETESILAADSYNGTFGSLWLYSNAAKATLHDGVKVCTAKTSDGNMKPAVYVSFGTFTMEGGTVYSEPKGVQGVLVANVDSGKTAAFVMNGGTVINDADSEAIKVGSSGASGKVNKGTLKGGTISGVVRCASGSVVLDKSISPSGGVSIGGSGKLVVNSTWTGTSTAKFDNKQILDDNGLVLENNGEAKGDFTDGTLKLLLTRKLDEETEVTYTAGQLINDTNKLKLVIAKVGDVWYPTTEEAVAAAADGNVITMAGKADVELTEDKDYYIDAAGNDIAVTGTGNLYAIDSANDDYNGCGTWTISGVTMKPVTQVPDGNRYVLILNSDDSTYSAHRLDIKIKAVNLRTSTAGLYYTAEYKCDAALAKKVASYGVGLSVREMPTADFSTGNSALTQIKTTDGLTGMKDNAIEIYSGAVTNIFTKTDDVENTDPNAENAAKEIYANAYLEIDTVDSENTYVFGNIGSEPVAVGANGDGAVYNMGKVLEAINSMVETDLTVKTLMTEFCKQWPETLNAIRNTYSIDAIIALIPSSDEENA